MLILALFFGCGSSPTVATTTPAATPPASKPAPVALADVGPDGPADLDDVPGIAELSTDPDEIAEGKAVFEAKGCGACHQFGAKLVGPDLIGVTKRRTVPWIEKMVRHPDKMTKEDPTAKGLFATHMVQMTDQGVPNDDLDELIAYLNSRAEN
jgi:cytochrome c2